MSSARIDAANKALFSVQIIALILKGLGDGETPVDPGVVEWLGHQLEGAHEAIEGTLDGCQSGSGA